MTSYLVDKKHLSFLRALIYYLPTFSLDFPLIEIPRAVGDTQCESYLMVETLGHQTGRLCGHHGAHPHLNTGSAGPSNYIGSVLYTVVSLL